MKMGPGASPASPGPLSGGSGGGGGGNAGVPSPGGLSFSLFVPAHFGTLDEKAKFHQVMRCCPSCGAPLVLFREKFGEVPGRSPPTRTPPGRTPPAAAPTTSPGPDTASRLNVVGITGGWVCTKCGVHIVPFDKPQSNPSSPDKHGGTSGRGSSPEKGAQKNSSRPGSREVSPHRPGGASHQGAPPNNPDKGATSPLSPKPPVIIDDDYEIWERQVRNSFTSFLTQIRERLGHKEVSLKQYQVTLCQRERQLRNNEESMQQRWNKMRQSEQNFKTKMDRLTMYKETMIHQLEAKARQLSQYEQRLRTNDFRASTHDLHNSTHDLKGSAVDFRHTTTSPPEEKQNLNVSGNRNASFDAKNTTNNDLWNTSVNSEALNASLSTQGERQRQLDSVSSCGAGESRNAQFPADHRPKVAVTMVKPTLEYRKPQTPASGETRGSKTTLSRDFRPNGASSANINQIYTRGDGKPGYHWTKQPPAAQSQPRSALPAPKSVHYTDSSNYMYRRPQKPLSPPASRNGSSFDVRQTYFPRNQSEDKNSHKSPPQGARPTSPEVNPSGTDVRHSGGDVRHSGGEIRHSGGDVRHSGGDVRHAGGDVRHSGGDVRHSGGEVRHSGGDVRHSGGDVRHSGGDVRHSGGEIRHSGGGTRHSGSDVRHSGGDTRHSGGDVRHTGPVRTILPPQQKPPPMPLKSALKSPDSNATQRWTTQTNLHVSTGDRADPIGARSNMVTSYIEHDNVSLSPSERERSVSGLSDLSPTYTTSGYASDRENSTNGGVTSKKGEKEKHNVSFEDMISTSSPQGTVERDTRPPWMRRRSRRLTEV